MKVVLKNVRLSFPSLWKTAEFNGQDLGKYEATFLIPKDDPQAKVIQDAVKQVGTAELGKDWHKGRLCILDGDTKDYDGYQGMWAVKASTKKRPVVLDRDKSALSEDDGRPYAGCYVNVSLSIYSFQNSYGKFVAAQLNGIQFHADGDAFGGNDDGYSDDDFDLDDSPVADDGDAPF